MAVSREPHPTAHPLIQASVAEPSPVLNLACPWDSPTLDQQKVTGQKENHSQDEAVGMRKMMAMVTASFKMIMDQAGF